MCNNLYFSKKTKKKKKRRGIGLYADIRPSFSQVVTATVVNRAPLVHSRLFWGFKDLQHPNNILIIVDFNYDIKYVVVILWDFQEFILLI